MAQSPAHTWGQIIGKTVEDSLEPTFQQIAKEYRLYLDRAGKRAVRNGKKVTWKDKFGNSHDLDFVFERSGFQNKLGDPVGFIEVAWRRYTKHSKNKAQEIQAALLPVAEHYAMFAPFCGAVVSGDFTENALAQLRSEGFRVLYLPYSRVMDAFDSIGIDARTEEQTSVLELERKIVKWRLLTNGKRAKVQQNLMKLCESELSVFVADLSACFARQIDQLIILPLFGAEQIFSVVDDALEFLKGDITRSENDDFIRVEIEIRYGNGDSVRGRFENYRMAREFLNRVS